MSKRHQDPQIQTFCSAATCKCRQLSRSTKQIRSYTVTRPPAHTFCSAATCQCRQLSRSTNKLHSYIVTRPPAEADSYRVRCPRGTTVLKLKHFVPRPPASADSYRVRQTSYIPTPSRGHLRTQAAIALNVIEARRSANSNVLVPRPPASADSYRARPNKFFLHRHAATCGRRQLSR